MACEPKIISSTEMAAGRFLKLERVDYVDEEGTPRRWEVAKRQNDQQAVFIVAHLEPSDRYILIRQFRVPVARYCIEVPAGLVDSGENLAQAAERELQEETGFIGTVKWVGPPSASSAGLCGECVATVCMTVDETCEENRNPVSRPDDGEHIQVFLVPASQLAEFMKRSIANGDVPDSRLVAWLLGMGITW